MKRIFFSFFLIIHSFFANESPQKDSPIPQSPVKTIEEKQQQTDDAINKIFASFPTVTDTLSSAPESVVLSPEITQFIQKVFVNALKLPPDLIGYIKQWYAAIQEAVAHEIQQTKPSIDGSSLTIQQLIQSITWQDILKMMICSSYDHEFLLLQRIHTIEISMFKYLPNFEVAYFQPAYTAVRKGSDYTRLSLILADNFRHRFSAVCTDKAWHVDSAHEEELYSAIMTFKKSTLYKTAKTLEGVDQTRQYPITSQVILKDGSITSAFQNIVKTTITNSEPLYSIQPQYQQFFGINKDNSLYLTALGNIIYKIGTTKASTNTQTQQPTLIQTEFFKQLFQEKTPTASSPEHIAPTSTYMACMILGGMHVLSTRVAYLFNKENLETTMNALNTLSPQERFVPNFIPQRPEDYPYLYEINQLMDDFKTPIEKQVQTQGFFGSLGHAMHEIGDKAGNAFKDAGKALKKAAIAIYHFNEDIAITVTDEVIAVYHASFVYAIINYARTHHFTMNKGLKIAARFQRKASEHLSKAGKDLNNFVDDLGEAVTDVAKISGIIVGETLAAITDDPYLANDIEGLFNSISDTIVKLTEDFAGFFIASSFGVAVLTLDAVNIIVDSVDASLIAAGSGGTSVEFSQVKMVGKGMLSDIIESCLSVATFALDFIVDAFKGIMSFVGYLASTLTDLTADAFAFWASVGSSIAGKGWHYKKYQSEVQEHRRLISAIFTTIILVAITVATGGAGVFLLALNIGMMVPNMIGANQEDLEAIQRKKEEKAFLESYQEYVYENEIMSRSVQNRVFNEMTQKLNVQKGNQEATLAFYQDFLNASINSSIKSSADTFGNFAYIQTIPSPQTNVEAGDPGAQYALATQHINVDPSQGFLVYNTGRNTFGQEIAAFPPSHSANTSNDDGYVGANKTYTDFWFNQKDIVPVKKQQEDGIEVEVRWRPLYVLNGPYYIGIFITERPFDIDSLHTLHADIRTLQNEQEKATLQQAKDSYQYAITEKQNAIDAFNIDLLNHNHLAKMFVCTRSETSSDPKLGIYEHEGIGWLSENTVTGLPHPKINAGSWYRMRAKLVPTNKENSQLSVKFWEERVNEPSEWQAVVTVAKSNLKPHKTISGTIGFIVSGASVEYNMVNPTNSYKSIDPAIKPIAQKIREEKAATDLLFKNIEKQEERRTFEWQQSLEQKMNPVFGSLALKPANDLSIKQGQYIYQTTKTLPDNIVDYVLFVQNPTSKEPNIGSSPGISSPLQAIVSLVSGNVYDSSLKKIKVFTHVLTNYQQTFGTISPDLAQKIADSSRRYFKTEKGPFDIGPLSFTGLTDNFANYAFVYQAPAIIPELKAKQSYDYYAFAQYTHETDYYMRTNDNILYVEQQKSPINAIISISTGKAFGFFLNKQLISSLVTLNNEQRKALVLEEIAPESSYLTTKYLNMVNADLAQKINATSKLYALAQQDQLPEQFAQQSIESAQSALSDLDKAAQQALSASKSASQSSKTKEALAAQKAGLAAQKLEQQIKTEIATVAQAIKNLKVASAGDDENQKSLLQKAKSALDQSTNQIFMVQLDATNAAQTATNAAQQTTTHSSFAKADTPTSGQGVNTVDVSSNTDKSLHDRAIHASNQDDSSSNPFDFNF